MAKGRNRIDKRDASLLFKAFGISFQAVNEYTVRLRPEESRCFFDWYYTTGTLIVYLPVGPYGSNKNMGKIKDPESVCEKVSRLALKYDNV